MQMTSKTLIEVSQFTWPKGFFRRLDPRRVQARPGRYGMALFQYPRKRSRGLYHEPVSGRTNQADQTDDQLGTSITSGGHE